MSYFSLAHRRLQCKHCRAFPGCCWILFPLLFVFHFQWEAAPPSLSCDRRGAVCSRMGWAGAVSPDSSSGCDSAEATGGSSSHSLHQGHVQVHSWLSEYFKQLGFCQVRTHSQTGRSSQDKACPGKSLFLIWHCSLEQEGSDPRTATAGVCLWRRFKTQPWLIPEFPTAKHKTLLVYSPRQEFQQLRSVTSDYSSQVILWGDQKRSSPNRPLWNDLSKKLSLASLSELQS